MNTSLSRDAFEFFDNYIEKGVYGTISLFSIITTPLSFLIFSKTEFKELAYKYIKLELIVLFMVSILNLFFQFYYEFDFSLKFVGQQINLFVFMFFGNVCESAYFFMNALSSLSCVLMIKNKISTKLYKAISHFKLVFLAFFILCLVSHLAVFFDYEAKHTGNENLESLVHIFEMVVFVIKDGLGLVIILVLNLMLLIEFKKNMNKKKTILKFNNTKNKKNSEKRLVLMTLLNFLFGLMGHLPYLVYAVFKMFLVDKSILLTVIIKILFYSTNVSYSLNIFIFYFGNKRFRYHLNFYFKKLFKKRI